MDIQTILNSLRAFHLNGAYQLVYLMSNNRWYFLIAISAFITILLYMKEETDYAVREEQNIL